MSVSIYNRSGGASSGASLKGVHSLIELSKTQVTSQCTESSALTTLVTETDRVFTAPYIPNQSFALTFAFIVCTTASSGKKARVMIYSDVSGLPDTLLGATGDLDLSTTGKKSAKFALDFVAGTTYWLAVQTDTSTAVLSAIPVTSLLCIQNRNDGAPYSIYSAYGTYASGAEYSFSTYTLPSYGGDSMHFVGLQA